MDDHTPKREMGRRSHGQDGTEDEVRRAIRELAAYFKGRRTHREALSALKTIKRFVRAQQKEHATTTVGLRSFRVVKPAPKGGG